MLAHRHDPDTSHDAVPASKQRELVKAAILRIIDEGIPRHLGGEGLAAFEVQDFYVRQRSIYGWPDVQPHSIPRRMSELHNEGRIHDTGERVPTPFGKNAVVWAATK